MKVLVVAYLFPPLGGPGVQRTLGFVRHLPARGVTPVVVASTGDGYWAEDPSLEARIPPEVEVVRVADGPLAAGLRLARRGVPRWGRRAFDQTVSFPDRQAPWGLRAARAARAAASRAGAQVVFATGAPWTDLVVGRWVADRLGLPLVTDLRDPWTDGSVFDPLTRLHRLAHRRLEGWVHAGADWVIANTQGSLDEMRASFPVTESKSSFIPNGWDALDYAFAPERTDPNRFTIGHAGNFYAGRGAEEVLHLLSATIPRLPAGLGRQLRLRQIGLGVSEAEVRRCGLAGRVELVPYQPLIEALRLLSGCHASLVTVPADARPGWVPQKLYQSLRLGRPVLTLAPPGDAAQITLEAGQPWVDSSRPDPTEALAEAIGRVAEGRVPPVPEAVAARYDRARLTDRLAERLEAVVAGRRRS